jgi:Mce-associated membrane protein
VTARRALWWTLTVVLALAVTGASSFGVWQLTRTRVPRPADSTQARQAVLDSAKTSAVKVLSYTAENVDAQLADAVKLTTGDFHDSYVKLIHDVVIPGAQQKNINATATVPAAAVVALTSNTATLIVFINQSVTVGTDAPTTTNSSVRERLRNINGDWLIEAFDPL